MMVFSAAPMRESTRLFFVNLNIFLYNCFGMSELSGPETYTNPKKWKNFTDKEFLREAGRGLDGLTISIDNPDAEGNGEICLRGTHLLIKGRNTFMGYFKDEEETKKAIDSKGFVHSGDVGKVDSDGNLTITGRIKELIITAGG
jgi:long-chain-fatty-acid--CoA ligase ACSBG